MIQEKLQNEYGDIIRGEQTRLMVIPPRFQHTKDVSIYHKLTINVAYFNKTV